MKKTAIKIVALTGLAVLFVLSLSSCFEVFPYRPDIERSDTLLYIGQQEVFFDADRNSALVSIAEYGSFEAIITYNKYQGASINTKSVLNSEKFDFGKIDKESTFVLKLFNHSNQFETYSLYFTLLPIIQIEHKYSEIPNEPKGIAVFNLSDPTSKTSTIEYCGIEIRGGSAAAKPKKSYGIEIREDGETRNGKNLLLLDMCNNDDWILDATYTDLSNTRNRVSFDIWREIQEDALAKNRNTLMSANKGQFIELFINCEYQGVYFLTESIDEELLDLNRSDRQTGYLYKSEDWSPATQYIGLPDTATSIKVWSGWEQKYPDPEELSCWQPLYKFISFVLNSDEKSFRDSIASLLIIDQAIDYYILMNLIQGADNAGKNIFMAKKTVNEPFYICPWDMDATWGRDWQGIKVSPEGNVSFKLFERLINTNPNQFTQKMKNRWFNLRLAILNNENLCQKFARYNDKLLQSGAAQRETLRWPLSLPDINSERKYIEGYIDKRLEFLDNYFNNL